MKQLLSAILALVVVNAVVADPTTRPASEYPLSTCIISGQTLGSMGEPAVKVIDGREVRFCCPPCIDKFVKGGEESHKKLDAAIIEVQSPGYPLDTCLVAGEKLGDMGEPILHVYRPANQMAKFCCKDCVAQFEGNPSPYLERLRKAYDARK